MLTIEEFLRLSNRLREYYGKQIKDRFSEYTFSSSYASKSGFWMFFHHFI